MSYDLTGLNEADIVARLTLTALYVTQDFLCSNFTLFLAGGFRVCRVGPADQGSGALAP